MGIFCVWSHTFKFLGGYKSVKTFTFTSYLRRESRKATDELAGVLSRLSWAYAQPCMYAASLGLLEYVGAF